jgi:hypothetical protein
MQFRILDQLFRVFIFLIFLFVVTPAGLLLRTFGIDYLSRNWRQASSSYWVVRDSK